MPLSGPHESEVGADPGPWKYSLGSLGNHPRSEPAILALHCGHEGETQLDLLHWALCQRQRWMVALLCVCSIGKTPASDPCRGF